MGSVKNCKALHDFLSVKDGESFKNIQKVNNFEKK